MFKKFFGALMGLVVAGTVAWNGVPLVNEAVRDVQTKVEVVTMNPGGSVFEFIDHYNKMRVEDSYLRVDGVCVSACTFFLGLLDPVNYCVSEKSMLGFHGVYSVTPAGMVFNQPFAEFVRDHIYNGDVVDFLKTRGFDFTTDVNYIENPLGIIWATGADVKAPVCAN